MQTEPHEFVRLRSALDDLVRDADAVGKRAIERGYPLLFTIASDALEIAARAVFDLIDARDASEPLDVAMSHAREQLAQARDRLRQAEDQLNARPTVHSSDAVARP